MGPFEESGSFDSAGELCRLACCAQDDSWKRLGGWVETQGRSTAL